MSPKIIEIHSQKVSGGCYKPPALHKVLPASRKAVGCCEPVLLMSQNINLHENVVLRHYTERHRLTSSSA